MKKLVEQEGEVVVTDQGTPRYRLIRYVARGTSPAKTAKDYLSRVRRHQPTPLAADVARRLHDENRGTR